MRLVNCGPGEWSDRLSILSLKILVGQEQNKDITHFRTEQTALLTSIRTRTLNGTWFEQVLELAAVNSLLWHAEDDLRAWREKYKDRGPDSSGLSGGPGSGFIAATVEKVARLAFRIQELNDRRAALVQEINARAGETSGMEKL